VDISFPEIEKFDHLPPARVEGATAFVSIMEGCSKYCTFCVVPYTRGEEVSRPLDDVLAEVAGLAAQGVKEVTLLGQNVNAYRGAWRDGEPPISPCCSNWSPKSPASSASATPPRTRASSPSA
jgi:tRNA-2-methylthio-N6-dimethylallyladenosine synthase